MVKGTSSHRTVDALVMMNPNQLSDRLQEDLLLRGKETGLIICNNLSVSYCKIRIRLDWHQFHCIARPLKKLTNKNTEKKMDANHMPSADGDRGRG